MGRVVKGVQLRVERYQLVAPEIAEPPIGTVDDAGDLESPDVFDFADEQVLLDAPLGAVPAGPAIDVEAVRAQAEALVEDATRNAEHLLADAHSRARALVEDGAARADAIAQEARKRGHDEGFHAGREAADHEMNDMLVTMRGLLEMGRAERHKLMEDAEPELVRLALGIAERVLHQQIALDRGGVVVDTDAGTIDARISTQLDEARKILHIEDDVIVEPAPVELPLKSEIPTTKAS